MGSATDPSNTRHLPATSTSAAAVLGLYYQAGLQVGAGLSAGISIVIAVIAVSSEWYFYRQIVAAIIFLTPLLGIIAIGGKSLLRWRPIIVVVFIVSFLASVAFEASSSATAHANAALAGRTVGPITVGPVGLVLVDIQVVAAKIYWVGPVSQRPTRLFPDPANMQADVGYIGQSSTTVVAIHERTTFRIPASNVVVETIDEPQS